jgi:hypothetical protein
MVPGAGLPVLVVWFRPLGRPCGTHRVPGNGLAVLFLVTIGYALLAECLTRPMANRVPQGLSVAALTREVVARNFHDIRDATRSWDEREVGLVLRLLISDVTGLDPSKLTDDTALARILN